MSGKNLKPVSASITSSFDNARHEYLHFITSIWFPRYKSLERGMRIDFEWPITAIVGPNGTNKTSILQALAAAPARGSIAKFWYSTSVDDIDAWDRKLNKDTEPERDPHRFVYAYQYRMGVPDAECRKARVTRPYRGKFLPPKFVGKNDPDYWEPTKLTVSDGMTPIPANAPSNHLHKDRWRLIQKQVIYLDLRAEASAYNKFVDHGRRDRFTDNDRKMRFKVQKTASELNRVLQGKTRSKRILSKVDSGPRKLGQAAVAAVSVILGKDVREVRVLNHRLYGADGLTFKLRLGGSDFEYSEAHAGSGEFNIIRLVDAIVGAPPKSLILLDEPEISLHPGAQRKFMTFLMEEVLKHKHQVVLSTHSPSIIGELPARAIKVLGFDRLAKEVNLLASGCSPLEAFNVVGYDLSQQSKLTIHVEDELAAELIVGSLRAQRPTLNDVIEVIPIAGGAESIVSKVIPALANSTEQGESHVAVLLDGDKRHSSFEDFLKLDEKSISGQLSNQGFDSFWKRYVSEAEPTKYLNSDQGNRDEQEALLIRWVASSLGFIGSVQPEEFLLKAALPDEHKNLLAESNAVNPKSWKNWWVERTRSERRLSSAEEVSAVDIFEIQKRYIDNLPSDHELFVTVMNEIERVFPNL